MIKRRNIILAVIMGATVPSVTAVTSNAMSSEIVLNSKSSVTKMKVTSSSNLNVRKGPSTKYAKIGSLKNGTIVNVISVSNGWAKINYNGTVAYCSASYLKAVATNESSTVEMIVKAGDLNVRSGASTKHSILGKVYKGDKVTVIQSLSNGWVKIEYKGKYGFVSNVNGAYLETSLTSNNPIVNTPIDSSGTYKKREMIAKVDDLNVRKGAGTKYKIIGKINKGDKVIALEELSNGWIKVEYKNKIGYVSNVNGAYLQSGVYVEDRENANNTMKLIEYLNGNITLSHKEDVIKARESYNALSKEAKSLVSNLSVLESAEKRIANLDEVERLIKSIDLLNDPALLSDKDTVSLLIKQFDALPKEYQKLVSNSEKLFEAELEIARLERVPASITVCEVMDLIYALPGPTDIHYSSEGDVKYARSAFRTLSPSDQLLVINIDKLDKAEAEWKRIDNGIKYVTGEIDKIPSIESLTLKDKHLVSNARVAYDNADKKITYHVNYINYDILEKAEAKINELEAN